MTVPSKAALRAELEAALANYRGPVKQCPAAPPPELVFEEELEALDDEDEADEDIRIRSIGLPALHDEPQLVGWPLGKHLTGPRPKTAVWSGESRGASQADRIWICNEAS
jgi:hypothetical protein